MYNKVKNVYSVYQGKSLSESDICTVFIGHVNSVYARVRHVNSMYDRVRHINSVYTRVKHVNSVYARVRHMCPVCILYTIRHIQCLY